MSTSQLFFWVANVLVVAGGVHLGLMGFFGYDLLGTLFGTGAAVKFVQGLIGVGTAYVIYTLTGGHYMHK